MKRTLGVLSVALAVLFTPNLIALKSAAIGASGSDALKHVWSQWFVQQQILSGEGLSLRTDLLNFPSGGPFFSLDTVNAILGLPLRLVLDPIATYNIMLIACVGASAITAAWLIRTINDEPWVAELGGIAFAVSAWVLCFPLASGVSETAVMWPLPLILLFAIRTWTRPGLLAPLLAGVLLTVQGAACWSHGITAGLLLLGLAVTAQRTDPSSFKNTDRGKRLLIMMGSALLCSIPLYLAVSGTVDAADAVKARNLSLFHSAPIGPLAVPEANSMALADFFTPGSWGRRVSTTGTEQLQYAAYPGFVLMGLAGVAIRRKVPWARTLGVGVLLMALLSMGPRLYLDHARTLGGMPNPIYLAAYWFIPLVNATIHSVDRFAVGLQLCLAVLAAAGLSTIRLKLRPWLLSAVLAEVLLLSPGPWPVPMVKAEAHPASVHIKSSDGEGAVIDLPFQRPGEDQAWFLGDIFLQQTVHERPIPFQLEGHGIETASGPIAANRFFRNLSTGLILKQPFAEDCAGARGLAALGVSWVVWQPNQAAPEVRDRVDRVLHSCLNSPKQFGDRKVFRLVDSP